MAEIRIGEIGEYAEETDRFTGEQTETLEGVAQEANQLTAARVNRDAESAAAETATGAAEVATATDE